MKHTAKSALTAVIVPSSRKRAAGAANLAVTVTARRGGERFMYNTCIIILVLSGIALVANVAVCLYTLHLAKQAENRQKMEGFIEVFINYETSNSNFQEHSTHEIQIQKIKEC